MADSSWFNRKACKHELDIGDSDRADDVYLDEKGRSANRIIDNLISPFKDTVPALGADLTEDLKEAAVSWVCWKYKRNNKEFDEADRYKEEYDGIIESVVTRLRASNESRSRRVAVSKAYATSPLDDGVVT